MAKITVAEAKVATLVDDHQLAFNAGGNSGIQEGDVVVLNRSVDIKDPDTGETLGSILLPKLRLSVNLVADAYSVARVIDRGAPPRTARADPWSSPKGPLKKVSNDPFEDDPDVVIVEVGERARFQRDVGDEPPF